MIVLYIVLPLALVVAGGAIVAFTWAARSGQLDDLDTPPRRMLLDDEALPPAVDVHVHVHVSRPRS